MKVVLEWNLSRRGPKVIGIVYHNLMYNIKFYFGTYYIIHIMVSFDLSVNGIHAMECVCVCLVLEKGGGWGLGDMRVGGWDMWFDWELSKTCKRTNCKDMLPHLRYGSVHSKTKTVIVTFNISWFWHTLFCWCGNVKMSQTPPFSLP